MLERFPCGRIPVEKTALAATGQNKDTRRIGHASHEEDTRTKRSTSFFS